MSVLFTTHLKLVGSMALWGGTWVAGRMLAGSLAPLSSAFLRFAMASIFLLGLCRAARGGWPRLGRDKIPGVLFLGATGVFLYSLFFFTGLRTVPAGRAALIVACIPVCIAACSAAIYRERFGPVRIMGTLLSLGGVAVVISDGNPLALLTGGVGEGDLLILGCVASWTAYSLGGREVMRTMPPLEAVAWSSVAGTLMLAPPALARGLFGDALKAGPADWLCLAYLGILSTGLAYFWYYQAIREVGPSRSGIFINLVPVFAIASGAFILGEEIHWSLLAGGAIVVVGVWLANRA